MHEFSIVQNLVEIIRSEMKKISSSSGKLIKVKIAVGELRQIVPEYLQSAFDIISKDTELQGAVIETRSVPLRGACEKCEWEGVISNKSFMCENCKDICGKVLNGKELYLETMEIEEDD